MLYVCVIFNSSFKVFLFIKCLTRSLPFILPESLFIQLKVAFSVTCMLESELFKMPTSGCTWNQWRHHLWGWALGVGDAEISPGDSTVRPGLWLTALKACTLNPQKYKTKTLPFGILKKSGTLTTNWKRADSKLQNSSHVRVMQAKHWESTQVLLINSEWGH